MRHHPARILPLALVALLTACGGGGDDPEPALLWEGTASSLNADDTPRLRNDVTLTPSPAFRIDGPARGEDCVSGTWVQTALAPGSIRLDVQTFGFAVQGSPLQISRTVAAAGRVEIPFRVCGAADRGPSSVAASVVIRMQGVSGPILGGYSATVHWQYVGTR